jgi:hypothetical protein
MKLNEIRGYALQKAFDLIEECHRRLHEIAGVTHVGDLVEHYRDEPGYFDALYHGKTITILVRHNSSGPVLPEMEISMYGMAGHYKHFLYDLHARPDELNVSDHKDKIPKDFGGRQQVIERLQNLKSFDELRRRLPLLYERFMKSLEAANKSSQVKVNS